MPDTILSSLYVLSHLIVWDYSQHVCVLSLFSCVGLFATPWTLACQAALSMEFSRQEYWSGLPCPPPGDLPDPEVEPTSPVSPALVGRFFTTNATWKAQKANINQGCIHSKVDSV